MDDKRDESERICFFPTHPTLHSKWRTIKDINDKQIRIIPSLMLRLSGFNTYILRNEVLSGYLRVSKRIEV